ncbi:MAG: dynamin family protein [Oscillospiraceae bacterium]|nr:dynamin family protein [Oscillospiraceae bacterium]
MNKNLEELIEISDYLGDIDSSALLHTMSQTLLAGNYVLTVMGQFSAGKSTLINNLLGRKVLPVNKTETTAVITYIKYGSEDYAELIYSDGRTERCEIKDTMDINQSAVDIDMPESINIYINDEWLKNGIVIADTPGVNTVLKEHTEKTSRLFQTSSRILYVVAGSMSLFDKEFLKTLQYNGLKTIIVRTYMDTIYNDEENPVDVVSEETEKFNEYTSDPVFFISSKEESSYYQNISVLRNYIFKNISSQAIQQLEQEISDRAEYISGRFLPLIEQRQKVITSMLEKNDEEYERQREEIEKSTEKIRKTFNRNREKLENRYASLKVQAEESLKSKAKTELRSMTDYIKSLDFTAVLGVHEDIESKLHKSCLRLRSSYVSEYDRIIKENTEELISELDGDKLSVYLDVNLPENMDQASDVADEIKSKIEALAELEETLTEEIEESKGRIADSAEKKRQIEAENEMINNAVGTLRCELAEYGDYVERYRIKKGSHECERKMHNIGLVADFASILIPGEAWVKLGGKLLSGTKVVKNIDTAADVIRGIHMIRKDGISERNQNLLPYDESDGSTENRALLQQKLDSQERKTGILDLLSLEYYFSKIGKKFDTPDTIVVDEEHKQRYESGRQEILNKINLEARKAADNRIIIGKIEDQKEQEEIFIKEQNKRKQKIEKEISELYSESEKAKNNRINEISASYYISATEDYITEFCSHILKTVMPVIDEKILSYIETYGLEAENEISKQKTALENLRQEFSGCETEKLNAELERCNSYIAVINRGDKCYV